MLAKAKIQHILFNGDNRGYGMTLYSQLSEDNRSLTYSYSIFNPKDKQFKKQIGREIAISHFNSGQQRTLTLDNLFPNQITSKNITFLVLWDIMNSLKSSWTERHRQIRLLRNLRDYLMVRFFRLS